MNKQDELINLPIGKENKRFLQLTTRDQKILHLLGEYGCVTADRIKVHFWNENSKSRAHYRRLGVLKRHLLIENVEGDGATTIGYRLTKRGKEYFSSLFDKKAVQATRRGYKTQFEHDQLLIDLRYILQKSPLVKNFKTENELRKKFLGDQNIQRHWENIPIIPDAVFTFETPGQKIQVAVELELTQKEWRRYTRIFCKHLLSKDWGLIIYVVKNQTFQEQLMKLLEEIKTTEIQIRIAKSVNGIYFCTLNTFLKMKLATPLFNGKKEISLEQIAKNFGIKT